MIARFFVLLAALVNLGACALTGGGAGDARGSHQHTCQTGGRVCG